MERKATKMVANRSLDSRWHQFVELESLFDYSVTYRKMPLQVAW